MLKTLVVTTRYLVMVFGYLLHYSSANVVSHRNTISQSKPKSYIYFCYVVVISWSAYWCRRADITGAVPLCFGDWWWMEKRLVQWMILPCFSQPFFWVLWHCSLGDGKGIQTTAHKGLLPLVLKGAWSGHVNHLNLDRHQSYLWNGWSYSDPILCTDRLYQVPAYGE